MNTKSRVMVYINGIKIPVDIASIEFEDGTKFGEWVDKVNGRLESQGDELRSLSETSDKHAKAIKTVAEDLDKTKTALINIAGEE